MLTGAEVVPELAPVPESAAESVLALVLTVNVPPTEPAVVGENVTVNRVDCHEDSLTLEDRPETLNAPDPETEAEFTHNGDDPLLLTVTVCCVLEPTFTVPNATELGLRLLDRLAPIAEQAENIKAIKAME